MNVLKYGADFRHVTAPLDAAYVHTNYGKSGLTAPGFGSACSMELSFPFPGAKVLGNESSSIPKFAG